jgi:hypothetical protein
MRLLPTQPSPSFSHEPIGTTMSGVGVSWRRLLVAGCLLVAGELLAKAAGANVTRSSPRLDPISCLPVTWSPYQHTEVNHAPLALLPLADELLLAPPAPPSYPRLEKEHRRVPFFWAASASYTSCRSGSIFVARAIASWIVPLHTLGLSITTRWLGAQPKDLWGPWLAHR